MRALFTIRIILSVNRQSTWPILSEHQLSAAFAFIPPREGSGASALATLQRRDAPSKRVLRPCAVYRKITNAFVAKALVSSTAMSGRHRNRAPVFHPHHRCLASASTVAQFHAPRAALLKSV